MSHPDLASQHTSALLGLPRRTQAMSPAGALPPVLHRHLSNGTEDMPLQHCLRRQEFHSSRRVFSLGGRPHLHTHRVAHYTPYSRITHSTLVGLSIPIRLSNHYLLEYSLLRAESQKTEQQNHTERTSPEPPEKDDYEIEPEITVKIEESEKEEGEDAPHLCPFVLCLWVTHISNT